MVFSVYLDVKPAHPENQVRAYPLRLEEALEEAGVRRDLAWRIRRFAASEHIDYRTLTFFAAPDGFFEAYRLQVDMPDAFRWDEPYVAPLMFVLDEYESCGVLFLEGVRRGGAGRAHRRQIWR
jgi:hypothetical protein